MTVVIAQCRSCSKELGRADVPDNIRNKSIIIAAGLCDECAKNECYEEAAESQFMKKQAKGECFE